jgi:anti-sigma factor RsiW
MECRRVARRLPALPDGEIGPTEAAAIQAHLAACPACAQEARKMMRLGDRLREHPVPDPGLPTGADAVAWMLQREKACSTRPERWRLSALAAAHRLVPTAVLVALILGAALVARPLLLKRHGARQEPGLDARPKPGMTLVIVDDERMGRQVLLAPRARDVRESGDARVQ